MKVNVWKMLTHHNNRQGAIAWTKKSSRIAIGWGRVGDISTYASPESIKTAIRNFYPRPEFPNNAHLGAPSLWDFYHEVKSKDLVILAGDSPRALVVEIVGPYQYIINDSPPSLNSFTGEYYNQREIRLTSYDPDKIWFAAGEAPGKHKYQTLLQCTHPIELNDF
jgi:predicted Mrr-cat superfamily restriction endonuclease